MNEPVGGISYSYHSTNPVSWRLFTHHGPGNMISDIEIFLSRTISFLLNHHHQYCCYYYYLEVVVYYYYYYYYLTRQVNSGCPIIHSIEHVAQQLGDLPVSLSIIQRFGMCTSFLLNIQTHIYYFEEIIVFNSLARIRIKNGIYCMK